MSADIGQIEAWRDPSVLEQKAAAYYVDLPYHNFRHAENTRDNVSAIARSCIKAGLDVLPRTVRNARIGALFHDAGFYVPVTEHGLASKEDYSADIAATELEKLGMPYEDIDEVVTDILGTRVSEVPKGWGGKALRRADLMNIATGTPTQVISIAFDLFNEDRLLKAEYGHTGKPLTFLEFARRSFDLITEFNADDVTLGDFDRVPGTGECRFTASIREKLVWFLEPKIQTVLSELGLTSDTE